MIVVPILNPGKILKYQRVKEFHLLAHMGCYC